MNLQVNRFTDEFKYEVVKEYLGTGISQQALMNKHNIRGHGCIPNWIRKFGLKKPSQEQIDLQKIMTKQSERSDYERELEAKVYKLEKQLKHEQFRTLALNTMIDIAEQNLKISIRKKAGTKR